MITPKAIISDSDGTLVNTLHLIRHGQYETFKTYFAAKKVDPVNIPDYETYEELLNRAVGGSARDTLERTARLAFEDRPHYLEDADFDELHDLLNPIQDNIAPEFVKAYEGLPSLLNRLGDLDVKLAIFTSGTPHHIVRNIGVSLPELGLIDLYKSTNMTDTEKLRLFEKTVKEHFEIPEFTVVTCDDIATHKPDPASLVMAMERLSVTPAKSLVFGDHAVDMQAGINAGLPVRIGVTHGFNSDKVLLEAGATGVVHSLDELTTQLG
ncbi:HAD family hydrolase [Candidatus Saccharibacteria bacterium]|nr:HAD family hydrolase [Candidatus Saccharibacteria bacterium]